METASQPLLAWDRAETNRRAARRLLAAFILLMLPVAVFLLPYFAEFLLIAVAMLVVTVVGALGLLDNISGEPSEAVLIGVFGLSMAVTVVGVVGLVLWRVRTASGRLLRQAGARTIARDEEPELWRRTENLCIAAGLPAPALYVIESEAVNALSAGLVPDGSSLAVTRGLLALLTPAELDSILAHELSKIGNFDVRVNTVLGAVLPIVRLPMTVVVGFFRLLFRLHPLIAVGAFLWLGVPALVSVPASIALTFEALEEGETLVAVVSLSMTLTAAYVFFGSPLVSLLLARLVSRERVFRADADAVLLTRNPDALATALLKVEAAHAPAATTTGSMAHAYFVRPLADNTPWWDRVLAHHPSERERVEVLGRLGVGLPPEAARSVVSAGERYAQSRPATMTPAETPPDAVSDGHEGPPQPLAYRLTAPAPLRAGPSDAAAVIRTLGAGELVVPQESDGDYLFVLCSDDRSGYIAAGASMEEVRIAPPVPTNP